MTSLEEVSLEVPMTEGAFFEIVSQLSSYPIRRFHLSLSAEGLGVFQPTPTGRNALPSDFKPQWLAHISRSLKKLEELVLDYRDGGEDLALEWPGDQVCLYARSTGRNLKLTRVLDTGCICDGPRSSSKSTHARDIHLCIGSRWVGRLPRARSRIL